MTDQPAPADVDVWDLDLTVRASNLLIYKLGCRTVADILSLLPTLEDQRGVGKGILREVTEAVKPWTDRPDQPDPIVAPVLSEYGRLYWDVQFLDCRLLGAHHISIDGDGRLSLTGIPWTLTPDDAEILSKALNNAAKWMATSWSPDFYDRLRYQREGGTDD